MARRFFAHGELPLVLLAVLAQRARHGYDVMAELARLFAPHYRPSPGTVYPALEALAAEGLVRARTVGERTVWQVTGSGRRSLDARASALAALEVRTGVRFGAASLDAELRRFGARLAPLEHRVDPAAVALVLDAAATRLESLAEPVRSASTR